MRVARDCKDGDWTVKYFERVGIVRYVNDNMYATAELKMERRWATLLRPCRVLHLRYGQKYTIYANKQRTL